MVVSSLVLAERIIHISFINANGSEFEDILEGRMTFTSEKEVKEALGVPVYKEKQELFERLYRNVKTREASRRNFAVYKEKQGNKTIEFEREIDVPSNRLLSIGD